MNMNKIMKKKFDDLYIGKRVELISTTDIWTDLRAGAQGTVDLIDDAGTIFVLWDGGSTMGLIPGEDKFKMI